MAIEWGWNVLEVEAPVGVNAQQQPVRNMDQAVAFRIRLVVAVFWREDSEDIKRWRVVQSGQGNTIGAAITNALVTIRNEYQET